MNLNENASLDSSRPGRTPARGASHEIVKALERPIVDEER